MSRSGLENEMQVGTPLRNAIPRPAMLEAEPAPLRLDLQRTAIMVIDMQNAYVSQGGMFDLDGRDTERARMIIAPIQQITDAARRAGVKVVYLAYRYSPDLRESGGPDSACWHKHVAITMYRKHPEWRDRLLIRGTWGADIVKELEPQPGDLLVEKTRFSAFFKTNLDVVLATFGLKYLVFVGLATNGCVEASIIDAFSHGFFPVLVSDATTQTGPALTQEAVIFNVRNAFGWVSSTTQVLAAIGS